MDRRLSGELGEPSTVLKRLGVAMVLSKLFDRFVRCESGVTALEYGLIVALISMFTINFAQAVGVYLGVTFTSVQGNLG